MPHSHSIRRTCSNLILAVALAAMAFAASAFANAQQAHAASDGVCSVYADNHLAGANANRLSWQTLAVCNSGVSFMKLTATILRDGSAWQQYSVQRGSGGELRMTDRPACTSGNHNYRVRATLNYINLSGQRTLRETSRTITC